MLQSKVEASLEASHGDGWGCIFAPGIFLLQFCCVSSSFSCWLGLLGSQPCSVPPQEVIRSILVSGRIGPDIKLAECYGLRLKHVKSDEIHWLHPDLTVGEVQEKYECLHLEAEWR